MAFSFSSVRYCLWIIEFTEVIYIVAGNRVQAESWRIATGRAIEDVYYVRDRTDIFNVTSGCYVCTGTWTSREDAFNLITYMRIKGLKELEEI